MNQEKTSQHASPPWWRGAAIYQIYPRSFADSTGNGIGDLAGITAHLDHVADLGFDAIWISPFFTSPMKDFGYDVADYYGVDPMFGTLDDVKRLLDRAHALGLKVLIDQVWSHTSDQHDWFAESRSSRDNPKSDWYVWADAKADGTPPNNWLSMFGGPAWTWDTKRRQYYLHNFLTEQPDLNFHNADVQDAILDVCRFWLELGVDGFRLDVCNFYVHDQALRDNPPSGSTASPNPNDWQSHIYCRSRPETLTFLSRLREVANAYGDICLMGEIADDHGLERMIEYTSGDDRLHTAYCFDFLTKRHHAPHLHAILNQWLEAGDGWPTWSLGNHDFPRVITRWGGADPSEHKARLFAAFQFCLRGSICIYQGEELGLDEASIAFEELQDPRGKTFWPDWAGRDGCRTPMPWTDDAPGAGFTSGDTTWLPIPQTHRAKAVSVQRGQANALMHHYQTLCALRRDSDALRLGSLELFPSDPQILGFVRQHGNQHTVCLFNFSDLPAEPLVPVDLTGLERLAGQSVSETEPNTVRFGPWGYAIYG